MVRPQSRLLLVLPLLAGCYIYEQDTPAQPPAAWPAPAPAPAPPYPAPAPAPPYPPPVPVSPADAGARGTAPPGAAPSCPAAAVDRWKELVIVDPTVIASERARNDRPDAPWSFRRRLEELAGPAAAADLGQRWLAHWRWVDSVAVTPGIPSAARVAIAPRPSVEPILLCPWLRLDPSNGCNADCTSCTDRRLPLGQAPFRLIAIVNRADLAAGGVCGRDGGELRFVYTAVQPASGTPLPFTVIFEYRLALAEPQILRGWAAGWRALGRLPFGTEFTHRLEALLAEGLRQATLARVQTNEIAFGEPLGLAWEMRQFIPVTGDRGGVTLEPTAAAHTPRMSLDGSAELGRWLADNARPILEGDNLLPPAMLAGGAVIPRADFRWQAPGADPTVIEAFNRNSCNGCHGSGTGGGGLAFQHLAPPTGGYYGAGAGTARVSRFLHDPAGGPDELGRRARLLEAAACGACGGGYPPR